jgi:PAS domain S-box-containing protein
MFEKDSRDENAVPLHSLPSELPSARKRLEQDRSLFETLINQSNEAILIAHPHTSRVLYANDGACENLGFAREELLKKRIIDIALNVQDQDSWRRLVKRAKTRGQALFETEYQRKDGSKVPVEVNVRSVTHDGREYIVSAARNNTERRKAREAVLEEKNKLEAVLAAIGDGLTVQDRNFRILYQNQTHREIHGDHVGRFCYEAYQKKDRVCEGCLLLKSFRDGKVHRREVAVPGERGQTHREVTSSPVRDARGSIIAGIEIVRDITERKKLETQLLHAQKLEAVGQLAGGVAHDFNNILTAIIGYGDILRMKLEEDDPLQSDVNRILNSAERAARLTQSLLAFSRRQVIRTKPVRLNEIVLRMKDLLLRLIGEDVELNAELASEDLTVLADTGQMEQVLMNLAANARDAMPQGGRLTIRTERRVVGEEFKRTYGFGKPGLYAVISVVDTGTGMDEHTIASVFEPFFTTKEVGRGTGLGLSTVYGVVKQHNGYITVESSVGKGTAFNLYLPVVEEQPEERAPAAVPSVPLRGTETVLVAEDSADVRNLSRATLEKFGYTVVEAVDGEDAVRKFRENRQNIGLLILDVVMPKKNGKDALQEIRAMRPDIKALFISGYTADIIDRQGIADESVRFIPKPFSADKLLGTIRDVLDVGKNR